MEGCYKGHVDIVKMLIAAKAQINTQKKVNLMLLSPGAAYYQSDTIIICILLL